MLCCDAFVFCYDVLPYGVMCSAVMRCVVLCCARYWCRGGGLGREARFKQLANKHHGTGEKQAVTFTIKASEWPHPTSNPTRRAPARRGLEMYLYIFIYIYIYVYIYIYQYITCL